MSQTTVKILQAQVPYVGTNSTITGSPAQAAAYYTGNRNLQTVVWSLTNVNCTLHLQATLEENPSENDWFDAYSEEFTGRTGQGYTNLVGNFVWVRSKITGFSSGTIQYIKMSF